MPKQPPQHDPVTARAAPAFADGTQACAGAGLEIFYPDRYRKADVKPAKSLCARCDIKSACAQWALNTRQAFGVWGGLTPLDRHRILRRTSGGPR